MGRIVHSVHVHSALIASVAAIVGACGEPLPEETGMTVTGLSCESQCEAEWQACLQEGTVPSFCEAQDDICIDDCSAETSVLSVKNLSVLRAGHVVINTGQADAFLGAATSALQNVDSSGDVSCDVTLQRTGSIALYDGDGLIFDEADLDRILDFPGNAKVVATINFCGTFGMYVGCARRPGTSFAVVRNMQINFGGQVWAHEYGHNKGLAHRTGINLLMNAVPGRIVNQSECNSFGP